MFEQNPLHIPSAPKSTNGNKNPKGRPRKLQSITFSAPPKSMVSQLIQKMISENNVVLPIKCHSDETALHICDDTEESNQTRECSSQSPNKMKPKLYSCDYSNCLYSTKLSSNLQKHKRRHTEEKPYLCDRCSFRTNFSNSLKVHKRLHTSERPYQCSSCDYRCNSISNLKKHSYTKHKNKDSSHGNVIDVKMFTTQDKQENT